MAQTNPPTTSTERDRKSRQARGLTTMRVDPETRAHLATIRARDGDATDRDAVARVVREAAEGGTDDEG